MKNKTFLPVHSSSHEMLRQMGISHRDALNVDNLCRPPIKSIKIINISREINNDNNNNNNEALVHLQK